MIELFDAPLAIVAALIYAVPPVIRLVEVGIRTVPATVREAAISAGSTGTAISGSPGARRT